MTLEKIVTVDWNEYIIYKNNNDILKIEHQITVQDYLSVGLTFFIVYIIWIIIWKLTSK